MTRPRASRIRVALAPLGPGAGQFPRPGCGIGKEVFEPCAVEACMSAATQSDAGISREIVVIGSGSLPSNWSRSLRKV